MGSAIVIFFWMAANVLLMASSGAIAGITTQNGKANGRDTSVRLRRLRLRPKA